MTKIPALHPILRAWLLEGPLSTHVPTYVARLRRGGYAKNTSSRCLNGVAHFAHWMSMCNLPAQMLDDGCIDQFLSYHLPRCDCPGRALRTPRELRAALVPLLAILREEHVIAQPPPPAGPIAEELRSYDAHMRNARGLAAGTRCGRLRIVERLLLAKFAGRPVIVGELQPEDVRRFIAEQLESLSTTSNAITIASTLRAYLRYRASCGDAVQPLLAVIASPPNWSLARLPKCLKPEEVDRLLSSFTDALPSPRRGIAVVRLGLDLGLRSIEINWLQLADIDWRMGTVTLKHTKSRRQDILPLPVTTGLALEAYLRHERPKTSDRAVFVRHLAPYDQPIGVHGLARFARYVAKVKHHGPLTVDLMAAWARQAKGGHGDRATSARQLQLLRPFTGWLRQFEPATEVPDEAVFGRVPGRMAPHVYREQEIVELLAAARQLGPPGGLRAAVMETLFGLIACTGLRISEALGLLETDVDLKAAVLTIRQSKFGKTRLVPLHPSAVEALARYRTQRARHVRTIPEAPFFITTRGQLLGQPLGDRQAHRIFDQLRKQLGWVDRGSHGAPRVHNLRHAFAVRRLVLWHEQGVDVNQRMLALSTYLGHAKVSNTYWYLTGVPELMSLVGQRFERFANPWENGDE